MQANGDQHEFRLAGKKDEIFVFLVLCGTGGRFERKDAHSNIGTACTDFEEGRNAASIRVEVVVELNGSL